MNQIQDFFRRHFYLVNLALVATCSSIGGLVVSNILEGYLISPPPKKKARRRTPRRKKKPKKKLYKSRYKIARRNIFCSNCEPTKEVEKKETAVASVMDAKLLVTLVSPDDPNWSMAAIRLKEPARVMMVTVGQKVGDAEITRVETRRVELRRNGRLEYLELYGEGGEVKKKPTPSKRRRRRGVANKYDKGIKKIGPNRYEVERKLVNEFLQNAAMAGRGAKIVPNMKGGKPNGFRLYAIRPYSIFAKLGIRNGDVIRAVNNQDITSPDKALELYTKLRGASHLTISLNRRNKPVTMHYTIR